MTHPRTITLASLAGLPIGQQPPTPDLRADVAALVRDLDNAQPGKPLWCYCGPAGVHTIDDYENWPEEAKQWARNMAAYAAFVMKDEA